MSVNFPSALYFLSDALPLKAALMHAEHFVLESMARMLCTPAY